MSGAPDRFLSYGRQSIDEDDIAALVAVLHSDYLTSGPMVPQFEERLTDLVEAKFAVACSSGTAALHLACLALGLGPEDVVVVPAVTFVATANAARYVGAEVVFADVDPANGLLTAETFDRALSDARKRFPDHRIRACLPVHLNGQSPEMAGISAVADAAGAAVIEDACHAIGGRDPGGAAIGACAHAAMACFSGHPVKSFAMGEGGAVTTNDPVLADKLALFRSHGIDRRPSAFVDREAAFDTDGQINPWYYEMAEMGFNYSASDLHCALGYSQLGKLEGFVSRRRQLAESYAQALGGLDPAVRTIGTTGGTPAWHLQPVLIDFEGIGLSRARVMRDLLDAGIGTQVHYIPVYRQPYYRARYGATRLSGAEAYYSRVLSLPLFVRMEDADVGRVVETLRSVLGLPA